MARAAAPAAGAARGGAPPPGPERRPEEVNANGSSGLTVWDWLHGTLRTTPPPEQVEVGVHDLRRPEEVRLPRLLLMPLLPQPRAWRPPPLPRDRAQQARSEATSVP